MKRLRLAGVISLLAVSLTSTGCTNATNAFDWMGLKKEQPKVAEVGAGDPDLYQRAVPGEALPKGALPVGVTSAYAPSAVPDAMVSADLPPEDPPASAPARRVAALRRTPVRPAPRAQAAPPPPAVRQMRAPAVAPPPVRSGDSAGGFAPDEALPAEMLSAQNDAGNTRPPAAQTPPAHGARVAGTDQAGVGAPDRSAPAPDAPGAPGGAPQPPSAAPPAPGEPSVADAGPPVKKPRKSGALGFLSLGSARYQREVTPVERLRAARRILAGKAAGSAGAPGGFAQPGQADGLGLRGPAAGEPARVGTVASLRAGDGAAGLAQSALPGAQASSPPSPGAAPVTYPDRERPMRIFFAPGKKKLSAQTIASIAAVANTQRALSRLIHVVGVAAAKGVEGKPLNTDELNQLALDRANAVASQLAESGVEKKFIVIHAQQEHRSANAAGGAPSARSRRVDIYLE